MPNWNPSFPEVLGNEFLANHDQKSRVWAGAPARWLRLPSTVTETIASLWLSASLDPAMGHSVPTLIDICEEGNEQPTPMQLARLLPSVDKVNEGWIRSSDSGTSNLWDHIDEPAHFWRGPGGSDAATGWILTTGTFKAYACSVNAAAFAAGGANENARIGWVGLDAIIGTNSGRRLLGVALQINGTLYPPAGGGSRVAGPYGATESYWFGEINPATGLPWKPADIADFASTGNSRLFIRSQASSTAQYPVLYAINLNVRYVPTENRVAVGVWRRPEDGFTTALNNIETTSLLTMPGGTANWSKLTGRNYVYSWRQSVSPSEYGAVVADDVRWNGLFQFLPSDGQPPGIVYPLTNVGAYPPPANAMAAIEIPHDHYGRPQLSIADAGLGRATYALAMERADAAMSVDSQPYRLDTVDLERVTGAQKLGQRVVPGSSQSYLGVRLPIIPPRAGNPTLTVEIRRVSDNVLIGGTFTITASTARALPAVGAGWRYIHGVLSSAAALVGGTAYEIRLSSTPTTYDWFAAMPDCSLANTASFGGSTSGGFIGSTHFPSRELSVTIVRQPDPPTGVAAVATDSAVTSFAGVATNIKHINVSWTQPAVGMGAGFARYEIERLLAGGGWLRVANVTTSSITTWQDREAPRGIQATYRVRAVGADGRFSAWGSSGNVTITDTRPMLILASNHVTDQFVHLYEITDQADAETVYPVLSTDRDEYVALHGADYQIVFMEAEDRGVGWRTRVSLKQAALTGAKGLAKFDALLDLVRSLDVPYVCAMDHQGTQVLGHVKVTEGVQSQPDYQYTAQLDMTPTHSVPVPAEVA